MRMLINTEAELKKSVAHKKACSNFPWGNFPGETIFWGAFLLGDSFPGGKFPGCIFAGGHFPGGIFPRIN